MASRNTARAGRPRRLPRHLNLDYTLIPAPSDLSLSTVTEKSPLPAIIVTPSSPSSTKDFSIAFLAPPKKPTLRERVTKYFSPTSSPTSRSPEAEPLFPPSPLSNSFTASSKPADECSLLGDTWRGWMSSLNPPIALPVTSPISGSAPNSWHKRPPLALTVVSFLNKPATRWSIIAILAFLLVLFHAFNHYLESSAGALRSRDLDGVGKAEVPFGAVNANVVVVEGPTAIGIGHGHGDGKEAWQDWKGWLKVNHGRGSKHRTKLHGLGFVVDPHVRPQGHVDGVKVASATVVPAAVRSAMARNEV